MRAIKIQYFLSFAVIGALLPYLPVYLSKERGFSDGQIGMALGAWHVGGLLTPVLMTLMADLRVSPRKLMAAAYLMSGVALTVVLVVDSMVGVVVVLILQSVALCPIFALQDGLCFGVLHRHVQSAPTTTLGYQHLRIWGTIGFIVPCLGIPLLLTEPGATGRNCDTSVCVMLSALVCLLGMINCATLPEPEQPAPVGDPADAGRSPDDRASEGSDTAPAVPVRTMLPTTAAIRQLVRPNMLVFIVGSAMMTMSITAFYAFFPLLLTDELMLPARHVGPIVSLGVAVEAFFVLGLSPLRRRMGLAGVMLFGAVAHAVRCAVLAVLRVPLLAIGVQVLHGPTVLTVHIAPPVYVNDHAQPWFRSSMQGIYQVLMGLARIGGVIITGAAAQWSMTHAFWLITAMSVGASVMFLLLCWMRHPAGGGGQPPQRTQRGCDAAS